LFSFTATLVNSRTALISWIGTANPHEKVPNQMSMIAFDGCLIAPNAVVEESKAVLLVLDDFN
jgi:hypothetical protein